MREFLRSCRYYFGYAFFFSMFINVLQLTFSIYMLQVYDKVLTSYNLSTLVVITMAAVFALLVLALLEWLRSRLLVRAGIEFDRVLSLPVLKENINSAVMVGGGNKKQGTLRDVQMLRNFLGGSAVFCFFDAPWMPLYLGLIFILHPALGMVAVFGGVAVIILGLLTDRLTKTRLESANMLNNHASNFLSSTLRNAPIVRTMGMGSAMAHRWERMNNIVIDLQTRASKNAGLLQSIGRSLRVGLQVAIYAVGAYLVITHQSTAGIMIAASIIMGRALAPIDQAMATYKQSVEARAAYHRLSELMDNPPTIPPMDLPPPIGKITSENLFFGVQGRAILKGINFTLPAGQSMALIGPSAAGKSTLCKVLLGIWAATSGKVRIDGADLETWDSEKLGPYIGYLPQDVELFSGSIAENIARMQEVNSELVIEAARMAGVHDLVLHLPKGYDTQIGEFGSALSGGQRQRIGLARALYGNPKVLVLDEPNSNLDEDGERALMQAVLNMRERGTTVILVSHKPNILSVVDNIMIIQDGQVSVYGPRQAVMDHLAKQQQQQQQQRQQQLQQQEMQRQQLLAAQQAAAQGQVTDAPAAPETNPETEKPAGDPAEKPAEPGTSDEAAENGDSKAKA